MSKDNNDYKASLECFINEHKALIEECDTSIKYHKDMCRLYMHRAKLADQQKLISKREIESSLKKIAELK